MTQVFYFMALAVSLVWCLPLLSGQKGPRIQPNGDATVRTGSMRSSVATSVGDEKLADYFIGVGDVLTISVWREEQASVDAVAVRSDGKITLPLVKEVEVAGLRPMELEKILNSRFVEFIREPEVTVMVREIHSQKVYVLGGVQSPGSLELRTRMTILQVLAEVGGLTEYAKRKKIYVLRDINAKQTRIPYDYDADLKGTGEQKPVFVKPGDTIVVPD